MSNQTTYRAFNPATGEPLPGEFSEATPETINKAVQAAEAAFQWLRDCPPHRRGEFLATVATVMRDRQDEIVQRCLAETGYLPSRVIGEFMRAASQLELFGRLASEAVWDVRQNDPADPERTPIPKPAMSRRLVPVGPVAVFGACNFPLAISVLGNDFVSAIAVGCPVVVKSHPSHPGTCELLGEVVHTAMQRCGFPIGTFQLLHGRRPETSIALVQHPKIAAVGFTGSPLGGRALADAILKREHPIPLFAELGSTNPVFLAAHAIQDRCEEVAAGFVDSLSFGNGHMCTKPGVLVVLEHQSPAFEDAVIAKLKLLNSLPMLSGPIAVSFDAGVAQWQDTKGVERLFQCEVPSNEVPSNEVPVDSLGPWHRGPHWFATDANTAIQNNLLHCETFGPVSMLVRCRDETEMLSVANQFHGSLTATVHADQSDQSFIDQWLPIAERFAGRIVRNGWPTGMEVGPATQHGGPYPASLDGRSTSVGYASLERFVRPVCYQNWE